MGIERPRATNPFRQETEVAEGQTGADLKHFCHHAPPPPANSIGGMGSISPEKHQTRRSLDAIWRIGAFEIHLDGDGHHAPLRPPVQLAGRGLFLQKNPNLDVTGMNYDESCCV
jgi:hypothetical protein